MSWRGDLVRLLSRSDGCDHEALGELLGFERQPDVPERVDAAPVAEARAATSAPHAPTDAPPREPLTFFRVEEVTPVVRAPVVTRTMLTEEDRRGQGRDFTRTPDPPTAFRWPSLEPRLLAAVSTDEERGEIDVDETVRRLSEGDHVTRLPRRTRRQWPSQVEVWADRSPRLVTLEPDAKALARQLEAVCGGVTLRWLGRAETEGAKHLRTDCCHELDADVVILVGDLGAFGTAADRAMWDRTADALRRRGVKPVALVPRGALSRLRSSPWRLLGLEGVDGPTDPEEAVERLLGLASAALLLEPGLLRAIRGLLPATEADVATEIRLVRHGAVRSADATGVAVGPPTRKQRLAELPEVAPARRHALGTLLGRWHAEVPPEVLHLETLCWEACCGEVGRPGDLEAAMVFSDRLLGSTVYDAVGVRRFVRHALAALPDEALRGSPEEPVGRQEVRERLQTLLAYAFEDADYAEMPATVSDAILAGRDLSEVSRWELRQVGGVLRCSPLRTSDEGSFVALLDARDHVFFEVDGTRVQRVLEPGVEIPLPATGDLVVTSSEERVRIGRWAREPWAEEAGRDRHGLWAVSRIGGVSHRWRYIVPGTFWMGSPSDEVGRWDDEVRRRVRLTYGFWLGETPVTQAVWEAVTGSNPSRFQAPDRPVEQVSWDDVHERFLSRLDDGPDGPRLPTEAEWERACRAGTVAGTWLGALEIDGDPDNSSNAPLLDGVAWYGGNSGHGFELDNGEDSSGWPNKQYHHRTAGSRPVAQRDPNPWGLFDVLGNVDEWCLDAGGTRSDGPVTDPPPADGGAVRVSRGGSWGSHARYCRAACRRWAPPDGRWRRRGFRLLRGPAPGGGAEEEGAER